MLRVIRKWGWPLRVINFLLSLLAACLSPPGPGPVQEDRSQPINLCILRTLNSAQPIKKQCPTFIGQSVQFSNSVVSDSL